MTATYIFEVFKLNIEKYFMVLIGLFFKSNRLYIMILVEAVSNGETRKQLAARVNFMKNEIAFESEVQKICLNSFNWENEAFIIS